MPIEETVIDLQDVWERYQTANKARIDAAMLGGGLLLRLKDETQHGDFLAFVDDIGINRRTAQRWMKLAGEPLFNAEYVTEIGGIRATLEYMKTSEWAKWKATAAKLEAMKIQAAEMDAKLQELEAERDYLRTNTTIDPEREAEFWALLGEVREQKDTLNDVMNRTAKEKTKADAWEKRAMALGWTPSERS